MASGNPDASTPLPPGNEAALRLLAIAALTRLAADGDGDRDGDADSNGDGWAEALLARRRNELAGLLAAQPGDFAIGWTFAGTQHYLDTDPAVTPYRDTLLPLFDAAGAGRDALQALLP